MQRDIVSEQQANIEFVKQVEKHPCLYNFELPSYARKDITERAWEDIGSTTNMTAATCKERWRNLRAVFIRTMKAKGKKKPYYLSEVMQFVLPFVRTSNTDDSLVKEKDTNDSVAVEVEEIKIEKDTSDNNSENDNSYQSYLESVYSKKRHIQDEDYEPNKRVASSNAEANDAVKSFLDSLLPELNEMNLAQFKRFKRKVLMLIDDIMEDTPASSRRGEGSERLY